MDEKKQIEEMAKVIDEFTEPLSARDIHKAEFSEQFAKHLYHANYRKQSEGRWIEQVRVSKEGKPLLRHYKCNLCGVYLATQANFCPNCGAKMKGGG